MTNKMTISGLAIEWLHKVMDLSPDEINCALNNFKDIQDEVNNTQWSDYTQYEYDAICCLLYFIKHIDDNNEVRIGNVGITYNGILCYLNFNVRRVIYKTITGYQPAKQSECIRDLEQIFNGKNPYKMICNLDDETCESCQ